MRSVEEIPVKFQRSHVEQTFLLSRPESKEKDYVYVKKRESKGATIFSYSTKHVFDDSSSAIVERKISHLEFVTLLRQANPNRKAIRKKVKNLK